MTSSPYRDKVPTDIDAHIKESTSKIRVKRFGFCFQIQSNISGFRVQEEKTGACFKILFKIVPRKVSSKTSASWEDKWLLKPEAVAWGFLWMSTIWIKLLIFENNSNDKAQLTVLLNLLFGKQSPDTLQVPNGAEFTNLLWKIKFSYPNKKDGFSWHISKLEWKKGADLLAFLGLPRWLHTNPTASWMCSPRWFLVLWSSISILLASS